MNFIVATNTNSCGLASKVAQILNTVVCKIPVCHFQDGESYVEIKNQIQTKHIYFIESLCKPVNTNMINMLLTTNAIRQITAAQITTIHPYIGYCRQDKHYNWGDALSFKTITNLLSTNNVTTTMICELHSPSALGFFKQTVHNLNTTNLITEDILLNHKLHNLIIVSPDAGGIVRAQRIAQKLGCAAMFAFKTRPKANKALIYGLSSSVENKTCIVIDDIIDTGLTMINLCKTLVTNRANNIFIYATHILQQQPARLLCSNNAVREIVATDSVDFDYNPHNFTTSKIRLMSLAPTIAHAILNHHNQCSS